MKAYAQIVIWVIISFSSFSQVNQNEYEKGMVNLQSNDIKSALAKYYNSFEGFGYDTMNVNYSNTLIEIGKCYFLLNQFDSSSRYFERGFKIYDNLSLPIDYKDLASCGISFYRLGQYLAAIKYFRNELDNVTSFYGKSSKESIVPTSNIANSFSKLNIFDSAKIYYQKTLVTKEIFFGKKSNEYALTLAWMIDLNIRSEYFQEAKYNLLDYLDIRKEISGVNDIQYINNLHKLALIYEKLSDSKNAISTYSDLTKIDALNGIKIDTIKSNSLISLVNLYIKGGDYKSAQNSLLELDKTISSENKEMYKKYLDLNVLFYLETYDFIKAYEFNQKIISFLSTDSSNFCSLANYFSVNGEIYRRVNLNDDAKRWFLRSQAQKKICGDTVSSSYAAIFNNLSLLYINTDTSTYYLMSSHQVLSRIKDKVPDHYANATLNLALDAFYYRKDTSLAYNLASEILLKYRKYLSAENLRRLFILTSEVNMTIGIDSIAANALGVYLRLKQKQLSELGSLSSIQLSTFFENNIFEDERPIGHILVKLQNSDSLSVKKYKLLKYYFDLVTIRNSLLLKINRNKNYYINKISQDGSESIFQIYLQKRTLLIELERNHYDDRQNQIEDLKLQIDSIENVLLSKSKYFSEIKLSLQSGFDKISNQLSNSSAAVVYFNEGQNYYAFIVTKKYSEPKLLFLFRKEQLDVYLKRNPGISDSSYFNSLYDFKRSGKGIKQLVWEPIDRKLEDVNTIFVVTSGILNTINLSFIPFSVGNSLADKYSLKYLGSAKDIISYQNQYISDPPIQKVWLFGGIDYNKISFEYPKINTAHKHNVSDSLMGMTRSGGLKWGYLKHTLDESLSIDSLCRLNNIASNFYFAEYASKTAFKSISGEPKPFILHIATHGYFLSDSVTNDQNDTNNDYIFNMDIVKYSEDPLVRSGLVFAGANKALFNTSSNIISDDGILSAVEISNLNLSNSKLVVLSSCESGLGLIYGSEGVFGLQRAFKLAGSQNIIMSLWSIPDSQTKELMQIFYSKYFSGLSIYESLKFAQFEMSKSYPPYFWAAFKLLE